LGLNVPLLLVDAAGVELFAWALPEAALNAEPPIAPPITEPATTAVRIHFLAMFKGHHLLSHVRRLAGAPKTAVRAA
jgi:hypothetical protein